MSDLHHLLTLPERPISVSSYLPELTRLLSAGIPATYTLEQAAAFERGEEVTEEDSNTTPLHILCRSLPSLEGSSKLSEDEESVVLTLMDALFEYGAGWNFLDYENKHIGDLVLERKYPQDHCIYQRIVDAGVSAELLLRKIDGGEIEFIDDPQDAPTEAATQAEVIEGAIKESEEAPSEDATAADQATYLKTDLEYTDDALVTKENRDGVMMDWETDIMSMAAKSLVSTRSTDECVVLNIGFGMGIIDNFIQDEKVTKHYICEAHPDVLAKMKETGWFDKENVVILEGRWQSRLNELLDQGEVFFDGIYYDTFSEHYQDMLDLYDVIVGLLKPEGTFSFFNGLGADRPICYDVYRKIVELDVANYGMECKYQVINLKTLPNWNDVKRSYFNCTYYYHPEIRFA
ncbi:Rmt2 [Kluyveromyces lactis]|nr:Rmt2 [Kluyveromyces lactis]